MKDFLHTSLMGLFQGWPHSKILRNQLEKKRDSLLSENMLRSFAFQGADQNHPTANEPGPMTNTINNEEQWKKNAKNGWSHATIC